MDQPRARLVANGQYIYFTGIRPGVPSEEIYVMRADGTDQTRLTIVGVNADRRFGGLGHRQSQT